MSKARSEYRILVVDDQKSMRGLATYFLKQIEFQDIDEAENAREFEPVQSVCAVSCVLQLEVLLIHAGDASAVRTFLSSTGQGENYTKIWKPSH